MISLLKEIQIIPGKEYFSKLEREYAKENHLVGDRNKEPFSFDSISPYYRKVFNLLLKSGKLTSSKKDLDIIKMIRDYRAYGYADYALTYSNLKPKYLTPEETEKIGKEIESLVNKYNLQDMGNDNEPEDFENDEIDEFFSFKSSPNEEQQKFQQVLALAKSGKIKEAIALADTLSDEYRDKLPEDLLFKFSIAEMSGTGGSAGFTAGTGVGVATKGAFGRRKKKKRNPYKLANLMNEILKERKRIHK